MLVDLSGYGGLSSIHEPIGRFVDRTDGMWIDYQSMSSLIFHERWDGL